MSKTLVRLRSLAEAKLRHHCRANAQDTVPLACGGLCIAMHRQTASQRAILEFATAKALDAGVSASSQTLSQTTPHTNIEQHKMSFLASDRVLIIDRPHLCSYLLPAQFLPFRSGPYARSRAAQSNYKRQARLKSAQVTCIADPVVQNTSRKVTTSMLRPICKPYNS